MKPVSEHIDVSTKELEALLEQANSENDSDENTPDGLIFY